MHSGHPSLWGIRLWVYPSTCLVVGACASMLACAGVCTHSVMYALECFLLSRRYPINTSPACQQPSACCHSLPHGDGFSGHGPSLPTATQPPSRILSSLEAGACVQSPCRYLHPSIHPACPASIDGHPRQISAWRMMDGCMHSAHRPRLSVEVQMR
jgi:hypothetical protein